MFDSVAVSVVFTAVFAVTGGYALLRWASLRAAVSNRPGDEVAELSHLLMSLAMIAMAWGYATPTGDTAQVVLFGVLGGYFLARMVPGRLARSGCACPAPGFHLLMCAAMVWMVVAMPWLMTGSSPVVGGSMQMDGMTMPMPAHTHGGPAEAPAYTIPLTVLIVLALAGAAGYWVYRLFQLRPAAAAAPADAESDLPAPTARAAESGTLTISAPRVSRRPVAGRLIAVLTPRADALCHLLMSVGMAAMLLLML